MTIAPTAYSITPVSGHTGAEVQGLDLRQPVDASTRAALNHAFIDHFVLVIRDQQLSPPEFVAAARIFGEVFPPQNSRFALPDCPEVHYLSNQDTSPDGRRFVPGTGFHSDHTNLSAPPKATVTFAVKLPDQGGDTQFANMTRAYDDLPDETKQCIHGLQAVHLHQGSRIERKIFAISEELRANLPDAVTHPIVRTIPETGRKALYINPIRVEDIVGMEWAEASPLLDELFAHATQLKYQYRHQWQPGDMVIWDNRCVLHKANADYDMSQLRYLYRTMLKGEKPA